MCEINLRKDGEEVAGDDLCTRGSVFNLPYVSMSVNTAGRYDRHGITRLRRTDTTIHATQESNSMVAPLENSPNITAPT